eukprot:scaffold367_cov254-Pinguiococcus_pyrenoidosus.AAC.2
MSKAVDHGVRAGLVQQEGHQLAQKLGRGRGAQVLRLRRAILVLEKGAKPRQPRGEGLSGHLVTSSAFGIRGESGSQVRLGGFTCGSRHKEVLAKPSIRRCWAFGSRGARMSLTRPGYRGKSFSTVTQVVILRSDGTRSICGGAASTQRRAGRRRTCRKLVRGHMFHMMCNPVLQFQVCQSFAGLDR